MKTHRVFLSSLALSLSALTSNAQLTTFKLDWSSSFSPAWATGNTTRTATNVGGSGTDVAVSMNINSGGIFTTTLGPIGGPMTPTVAGSTFIVPGSSQNLQVSLDFTTNSSFVNVRFNFSTMVSGVSFRISDIDRLTNTLYNYLDEVRVTGTDGLLTFSPTITKYDNSDPTFLIISGNTARINGTSGVAGNTASDATDQRGTVNVDFGGTLMNSVTVRYRNAAGTQLDPTVQNISIGDITFQKNVLPVKLISFGASVKNNKPVLDWKSATEVDFSHYVIERSTDGNQFTEIAQLDGKAETDNQENIYSFTDINTTSSKYYYRLKMVDDDGTFAYSKVVVAMMRTTSEMNIYPTLFSDHFNVVMKASGNKEVMVTLADLSGRIIFTRSYPVVIGQNQFRVETPSFLSPGHYVVMIDSMPCGTMLVKN
jgi:hypothetical protein